MKISNFVKLIYNKKEFLILIFSNLIAQLGITYYIMERTNKINISILPLFIIQLVIIVVMTSIPIPIFMELILFCVLSYTFGIMLSILKEKYNSELIKIGIKGALTIFILMLFSVIILFIKGINLSYKLGGFLFWGLLILIVARLISNILNISNKILSFIGIILFAIYILYDTNKILQRNYYGDFVTASMDYYLDILNLFTNILGSNDN